MKLPTQQFKFTGIHVTHDWTDDQWDELAILLRGRHHAAGHPPDDIGHWVEYPVMGRAGAACLARVGPGDVVSIDKENVVTVRKARDFAEFNLNDKILYEEQEALLNQREYLAMPYEATPEQIVDRVTQVLVERDNLLRGAHGILRLIHDDEDAMSWTADHMKYRNANDYFGGPQYEPFTEAGLGPKGDV